VRIVLDPDATPVAKGKLCSQLAGFNLHAQTKVAANDKKGRENLCKYILRPPLASRVGSRPVLPAANGFAQQLEPPQDSRRIPAIVRSNRGVEGQLLGKAIATHIGPTTEPLNH
jgi:hypothetical protein